MYLDTTTLQLVLDPPIFSGEPRSNYASEQPLHLTVYVCISTHSNIATYVLLAGFFISFTTIQQFSKPMLGPVAISSSGIISFLKQVLDLDHEQEQQRITLSWR